MKRTIIFTLIMLLLAMISLSACNMRTLIEAGDSSASLELVDDLEREVNLKTPPQRIVSLSPSNTELLFAVGAGAQVVGCDDFSDYPTEAQNLPKIGGSMGDYNLEEITRLEPDLVLAAEINPPELVETLSNLGITVYYLANPASINELFENINTIAALTGHSQEAEKLVASLKAEVEKIRSAVDTTSSKPVVFYELDGSDPARPWTAGPGSFHDTLISQAGGVNAGSSLTSSWAQINQEDLLVQDPDIIILGDSMWGMTAEQVAARPGWGVMSAVINDRIYPINDDLISRPTPRQIQGLAELVRIIHPEVAGLLE